ncbi:S-adenosyl-L-methionine-dependent methyltransferase [Aspergillus alliaceus]|uniref:S-adenosyl-L-methionine-dependent methyltransferase n=1 Tax=Petromyces alliaceus TaxID=209559 RepID=A0A5N7C5S1_PETAA|nr:S-adenosyl-L-methionine-dependent methyltransferase [Aspergillus alliaceus]
MTILAEALFDAVAKRYEESYGPSTGQGEVIKRVLLPLLPPQSRVLDVGCGTGRPVAETLSEAGHSVVGIDISQEMVNIARQQVPGASFEKADMMTYTPPNLPFDAVCALLSLFQLGPDDTASALAKFSEWLAPDGIILLCTILSSAVRTPDITNGAAAQPLHIEASFPFMGHLVSGTYFSREGWHKVLATHGFAIESEKIIPFRPIVSASEVHVDVEEHYYILARKKPSM